MSPEVPGNQTSYSPTNTGSSCNSTNDSDKGSNWSNRSLKATGLSLGGLAAASLLNHYSPCSFGQSLLRHTIAQVPALLYILGTTKVDPSLMIELNRCLEDSIIKEAGIPEERKTMICAAKCALWLNDPQDFPVFDPDSLNKAYRKIYDGENRLHKIFEYFNSKEWQFNEHYTTDPDLVLVEKRLLIAEYPPIESLKINEALICIMIPEEGLSHMCVLLKKSESEFTIYDPSFSLPIKTKNTKLCIEKLSELAEVQRKRFLLFSKVVPKN